jgi:glycopeptide antibiotics resistance protein
MTSTTQPATQNRSADQVSSKRTYLAMLFVVYLVLLTWIVLWKLDIPWVGRVDRVIKLVPFAPDAGEGASEPVEVGMNLLLFVPVGVYLGLLAPSWRWWKVAATAGGLSLLFEITQFVLAIGSSDITDLIVNTAGGLAGFGLLALARRRLGDRTVAVMTRACTVVTALAVLACGLFIALPVHYAPPAGRPGLSTQLPG